MKHFVLKPLIGIDKINLGDSRDKVREIMGKPSIEHEIVDYYYDGAIRFDYDEENILEFIEFDKDEHFNVEIYGINPFTMKAKELEELLRKMNADGMVNERNAPFTYIFNNISVAVYRDVTEQDILISIEEAKQDGTYEEDKEWLADELEKYSYFQTIGIGKEGHYIAD
ncbi:MAG: outer membrane protein assembly factor BamE [Prevotellaceae bacterium]|jgi:hypothetical protein|nr:outer membrane protein assembly factor BamE [Prevotellaceae bacterium]